ncbi:putative transcriptional regulator [Candidatus Methanoperedens nitroreducens]|uniref:Putative transcriptional regulator n=1 Tax=Candidatus Methanoperedens nitratireducens TaxID=1392998 RepID=A0A062VD43_9EURY|nr:winged helix-turn-helix domain-containing protein [Candidatus Methanoperedens nitroreducens]KCZ73579.1 putative transcriptional regulator [Candidatus Methanoperedens nitroreducens]MDJ1422461.1 winged helix-turn-helix domain-containing protein [Candidatus Methanoperedens sp.]
MSGGISVPEKTEDNGVLLNLLVLSEKRKNLLLLLREGPKTLGEIRESLLVTSSGIIPQIRKMEEKKLIYQKNREYALTEIGKILAEYFYQFKEIMRILGEDWKFWSEHKISGIPEEFHMRLHELGKYEILKSTPIDILKPHREYMKNLLNARWMKGVSSVLYPGYPEYVIDLAQRGIPVSIIVTRELLEKIEEEYSEELEIGLCHDNVSIMVCDERIDVTFAVTDFFLSMRLFLKDGTYDFHQNILSFDISAIRWGEDLFSYYERRSRRI